MSQYRVNLPFKPDIENCNFALWVLSPWDINQANKALTSSLIKADSTPDSVKEIRNKFHPTAMVRKEPPVPLREYFNLDYWFSDRVEKRTTALYHGVGRDNAGVETLRSHGRIVTSYDPCHPNPVIATKPTGTFDEIFSIYTLCVTTQGRGRKILEEIEGYMKDELSVAIVAVRRDLKKEKEIK